MHILIVRNNSNSKALDASLLLMSYLNSVGASTYMADSSDLGNSRRRAQIAQQLPEQLQLAFVLGGDGTVLHTVHLLEGRLCPILPINFGRMGFLTNNDEDGIIPLAASALAGELGEDRRALLQLEVTCQDGGPEHNGAAQADDYGVNSEGLEGKTVFTALNEASLTRGAMGRIIEISLAVNGIPVFKERGDGIILSTATGSTAYALSSGGPLVSPRYSGLLAVPIAPHTLRARAIVTDPNDVLEVTARQTDEFRDIALFIDGELVLLPGPVQTVIASRADQSVTLLRPRPDTFYQAIAQDFFA